MDFSEVVKSARSPSDDGLICNETGLIAFAVKTAYRLCSAIKEPDLVNSVKVINLFKQRAISIEKNG